MGHKQAVIVLLVIATYLVFLIRSLGCAPSGRGALSISSCTPARRSVILLNSSVTRTNLDFSFSLTSSASSTFFLHFRYSALSNPNYSWVKSLTKGVRRRKVEKTGRRGGGVEYL